jgi:hypothetical protein
VTAFSICLLVCSVKKSFSKKIEIAEPIAHIKKQLVITPFALAAHPRQSFTTFPISLDLWFTVLGVFGWPVANRGGL